MFLRLSPAAFVVAWHLLSSLLVLSTSGSNLKPVLAQNSDRDVILFWNNEALDTVRELSIGAFDAARTYAMVNAAMFDAIIGSDHFLNLNPAVVDASPKFRISRTNPVKKAAANAAAHAVLSNLFPDRATTYDSIKQQIVDSLRNNYSNSKAAAFGADVGAKVYSIRLSDGTIPKQTLAGGTGSTVFRADFGSASFADMEEFIIADASVYKSQGPPATNSREYLAAHTEVRLLDDASYENQEYDEIFRFWKAGGGTVRPPGEWIKTAIVLADDTELRLLQTATLFVTLSLGLADTAIAVASNKEEYQYWRPATAILEANDDGNPDTVQNDTWEPRNGSIGGSPEHTSGQSAFAGCASTILAEFFRSNEIEFTIEGDNAIAGPRTYSSFSEAAAEAGRSRIFSGIHFEFSNQAGQQSERDVAREVLKWQEPFVFF